MSTLRQYWSRFWALPWARKGPALAVAALVPLVAIGVTLAVLLGGPDGDGDSEPTATVSTTSTATPLSPTPSATPARTPTSTLTPTPRPAPSATPSHGEPTTPPQRPGQSRGRPAARGYRLVGTMRNVADNRMLAFVMIPGSNRQAIVVTQGGMIWRVSTTDAFQPQSFGDVRSRLIANPEQEEGLLGFAFSPDYSSDRRVYVYYTAGNPRRSVLARFRVNNNAMNMGSERVLLNIPEPYANHNGGHLAFGPDGMLYVSVGDGGSGGDPQGNAQNRGNLLGKILRLDVSGSGYRVPPDNPFAGVQGVRGEIFAYGLRNPWSFSFDRATGALWAGDVGQGSWEEVDHIVAGGNYGWNVFEGFTCYSGACGSGNYRTPRAVYGHALGCSITGGHVYRGPSMPELQGWFVYGDYCSGRVWAVNTNGRGDPVLLAESGLPISNWGELANGEIVAVTFANRIYRLERAS